MRRPRNNVIRGAGDSIEQNRRDVYEPVADTFEEEVGEIRHAIWTANTRTELEDRLVRKGIDVYDIVQDPTTFDQAFETNDMAEMRRQILMGLERWAQQVLKNTEQDNYNASSLMAFTDEDV